MQMGTIPTTTPKTPALDAWSIIGYPVAEMPIFARFATTVV